MIHTRAIVLVVVTAIGAAGCASPWGRRADNSALKVPVDQKTSHEVLQALQAARDLEMEQNPTEAIAAYRAVLDRAPNNALALHRMAVLTDMQGAHDEAESLFHQALEVQPDNADLLCDFGYSRYLQGDFEYAQRAYRESLQHDARSPRTHTNLGLLLVRLNRETDARDHFAKAGCDPAAIQLNLAYAYMWDEQWTKADACLKEGIRLRPDSKGISDAIAMMDRIRPTTRSISVAALETEPLPPQLPTFAPPAENNSSAGRGELPVVPLHPVAFTDPIAGALEGTDRVRSASVVDELATSHSARTQDASSLQHQSVPPVPDVGSSVASHRRRSQTVRIAPAAHTMHARPSPRLAATIANSAGESSDNGTSDGSQPALAVTSVDTAPSSRGVVQLATRPNR